MIGLRYTKKKALIYPVKLIKKKIKHFYIDPSNIEPRALNLVDLIAQDQWIHSDNTLQSIQTIVQYSQPKWVVKNAGKQTMKQN